MPAKLEGMGLMINKIKEMEMKVNKTTREAALKQGAEFMREKVRENIVAKDLIITSNLKDNIQISEMERGKVEIGYDQQGDAFYGYFLEFGRSPGVTQHGKHKGYKYPGMEPRPFVGPAFENNQDKVQDVMGEVIKRELNL